MSNGPTHATCNVKRSFTFDPKVLAWSTNVLKRIKWCWMCPSLCHLEHVFCHESQIKELVPLLSRCTYKVSRKKTLAQDLQYSCCYGAHIFLSTKKHLGYIQNMCFSHAASPQMVKGSQNCTCLYL
jgi:hypothetical protein